MIILYTHLVEHDLELDLDINDVPSKPIHTSMPPAAGPIQ